jgi:hypothetical protein
MSMLDNYWAGYEATLARIRTEKPQTVAAVVAILGDFEAPSSGAAFFPTGGDDQLCDALSDAGWAVDYLEGDYLWNARHRITRETLHFVEGDIYPGEFQQP